MSCLLVVLVVEVIANEACNHYANADRDYGYLPVDSSQMGIGCINFFSLLVLRIYINISLIIRLFLIVARVTCHAPEVCDLMLPPFPDFH
jgi:hypothetical protein